jgi:hypothetical protein
MSDKFWEMYRLPQWQKRRLEIMQIAEFRCAECGDDSSPLNVHHAYYTKGALPWEYPDSALKCLCGLCHEAAHEVLAQLKEIAGLLPADSAKILLGYAKGLLLRDRASPYDNTTFQVETLEEGWGLAAAYSFGGNEAGISIADLASAQGCISHADLNTLARAAKGVAA